jgi:hypothetical protein
MAQDDVNDLPYLFVPTYPPPLGFGDDSGANRPVPNGVVYYLCPGIQVLNAFQPGSPLTVKVVIANWQGGSSASIAFAAVWWSPAFSGTIIPDPDKLIGVRTVPLPPHGGQATTSSVTVTIPADAPPHICLVAKVWHPLDLPPTTLIGGQPVEVADPVNDRHWAQHNLIAVQAAGPQKFQFLATNVLEADAQFILVVRPLNQEGWSVVARTEQGIPVQVRARLRLAGAAGDPEVSGDNTVRQQITLKGSEHRIMTLAIELLEPLHPGTFAPFEILQLKGDTPIGGIALVLRAAP